MKIARSILLAIAATLSASGCRAWNHGHALTLARPPAARPSGRSMSTSLSPSTTAMPNEFRPLRPSRRSVCHGAMMKARADGKLALERPRNFKLELMSAADEEADIGSNDEEFWFWVQR